MNLRKKSIAGEKSKFGIGRFPVTIDFPGFLKRLTNRVISLIRSNKKRARFISLFLVFVFFVQILNVNVGISYANETAQGYGAGTFASDDNGYIKYYVDQTTGGFYIMPSSQAFDASKAPSFGSVRVNNTDYIFGGNYPGSSFVMPPAVNESGTCQAVWRVNDIYITQYLNIIQNDAGINSYAVYIRYEVEQPQIYDDIIDDSGITEENTSPSGLAPSNPPSLSPPVEVRILIDTSFGSEDNVPVTVSNKQIFITNETAFEAYEIPDYYGVDETFTDVTPRAYGLINDATVTKPVKLVFAHFENARNAAFDYQPNGNVDFTAGDNQYGSSDSAALLYFKENTGDTENLFHFSTIYGFDGLTNVNDIIDEPVSAPMNVQPLFAAADSSGFLAPILPPVEGSIPIATREELEKIGNDPAYPLDGKYHLVEDIDLAGEEWVPIGFAKDTKVYVGLFKGIFDGQGHIIKNLTMHDIENEGRNNGSNSGLFGDLNGEIKNIGLEAINIDVDSTSPYSYVGGLCGIANNGSIITNSYTTGSINVSSDLSVLAGGICGYGINAEISYCYNYSNLTVATKAGGDVGGICGSIGGIIVISDSFNAGAITTTPYHLTDSPYHSLHTGGICGSSGANSSISNCYNTGNLSSQLASSYTIFPNVGAICGLDNGIVYNNCYWNIDSAQIINGDVLSNEDKKGGMSANDVDVTIPYSTAQMKLQSSYLGFDFDTVWKIDPLVNNGFPAFINPGPGVSVSPAVTNISVISGGIISLYQGKTLQLTADVSTENNAPSTVTWEVSGNLSAGTSITQTGLLTVAEDETAEEITIKAVSTYDSRKYDEVTIEIIPAADFTALSIEDGFIIPSSDKYPIDALVSVLIKQDPATFDADNNPTRAVKSISLKNYANSGDIPFTSDLIQGSEPYLYDIEVSFTMPYGGAELTLTSTDAYRIDLPQSMPPDISFTFEDLSVNTLSPFTFSANAAAANHGITLYLTQYGSEIPNEVVLIGQSTSQAYPIKENEAKRATGSGGEITYAYEFVMPEEHVFIDFSTTSDANHKYEIIPSAHGETGALAFTFTDGGAPLTPDSADGLLKSSPNSGITVNISGIDYENYDFHSLTVYNYVTGEEYAVTPIVEKERYTFTMPSASVFVYLDVREKPLYEVNVNNNNARSKLELLNKRSGDTFNNSLTGYANDTVSFTLSNTDVTKVIKSISLLNKDTGAVIRDFPVPDAYIDVYADEFLLPAAGSVLNIEYIDAPLIPIEVDSAIAGKAEIVPSLNEVGLGGAVSFEYTTTDARYLAYRPVLKSYGSNGSLLYEEYYQHEEPIRNSRSVAFVSEPVRKADGIPAKIVLSVYEQTFQYKKQLASIAPNSTQAELFTEIWADGSNLFEEDKGAVYIRTDFAPSVAATVKSYGEKRLVIDVPDNMMPLDDDVTYYVEINGVEKSCTVQVNRLLRFSSFGWLAVVSDSSNKHSVIVADNEAELMGLKGGNKITLKLRGNVKYNANTDVYEFLSGNVLINNLATYAISPGYPLNVKQNTGSVAVTASGGRMSIPSFTFVNGENIAINLVDNVEYVDAFVEDAGNGVIKRPQENITVEYKTPLAMANTAFKLTGGFVAEFKNVRLLKDSVVFGGLLQLSLKKHDAKLTDKEKKTNLFKIDAKRVEFGQKEGAFTLKGIEAAGELNTGSLQDGWLLPKFKPDGDGVSANINTYKGEVSVKAKINFTIIKVEGSVALAVHPSGDVEADSMQVIISFKPGFPVIPGLPAGNITSGGLGFEGLAKTSSSSTAVKPFKVNVFGSLKFVELLELQKMKLSIGADSTVYTAEPAITIGDIKDIKLFDKFEGGVYYGDGLRLSANVKLVLVKGFEVINAGGMLNLHYTANKKFIFAGELYANVQVPEIKIASIWIPPYWVLTGKWYEVWKGYWAGNYWKPINIGPIKVASVNANVNNSYVSSSFKVLGFGLEAKYKWGDRSPTVSTFGTALNPTLETTQELRSESGEYAGEVSFASNLSIAARSDAPVSGFRRAVASPSISTNEEKTVHTITFPADINNASAEYAVMINAPRDSLSITSPSGKPVILQYLDLTGDTPVTENDLNKSGINAVIVSTGSATDENGNEVTVEDDEGNVFVPQISTIMLRLPDEPGDWTVSSVAAFGSVVLNVNPLPELTNVEYAGGNTVKWSANNIDLNSEAYKLELMLSLDDGTDPTTVSPGIYLDETAITANAADGTAEGELIIAPDLMEDFESGNYYPRLVLSSVAKSEYDSLGTEGAAWIPRDAKNAQSALTHVNPNQPAAVSSASITPGGNGNIKAEWQKADDKASGYIINAFHSNGAPVYQQTSEAEEDLPMQMSYNIPNSLGDNGAFEVNLEGLSPGAEYYLEIIPYTNIPYIVDGEELNNVLKGTVTKSNTVQLPVPNPPAVSLSLPNGDGVFDSLGGRVVYVNGSFNFGISSLQNCSFTVTQDDTDIYTSSGYETGASVTVNMEALVNSSVEVTAVNSAGDSSTTSFTVYLDDVPPPLFISADDEGNIITGQTGAYIVQGYSEPNAVITDDLGNSAVTDENGEFNINGNLAAGAADSLRSLTAKDYAGNIESADILIKNFSQIADSLQSISLIPSSTVSIIEGEGFTAAVKGTLTNGDIIDLSPNTVNFNVIEGGGNISVNSITGKVTAITEGYAALSASVANGGDELISNVLTVLIGAGASAPLYGVTVASGGTGAVGGGSYAAGSSVEIYAGTRSGYTFSGWTSTNGMVFADASNVSTSFTMPNENVTVTANWKPNQAPTDPPSPTPSETPTTTPSETPTTTPSETPDDPPTSPSVPAPVPVPPTNNGTSGSTESAASVWQGVREKINAAKPGDTVKIETNGSTLLPALILNALKGKDVTLELDIGGYSWTIAGMDVKDVPSMPSNYELSVRRTSNRQLDELTEDKEIVLLETGYKNEFPFTASIEWSLGSEHKDSASYLYYYNDQTKTLEFLYEVIADSKGTVKLSIDKGSRYALLSEKLPDISATEPPVTEAEAVPEQPSQPIPVSVPAEPAQLVLNESMPVDELGFASFIFLSLEDTGYKYGLIKVNELIKFFNAESSWDDETGTATVTGFDRQGKPLVIKLTNNSPSMTVNGIVYDIAEYAGASELSGRYSVYNAGGALYLPVRAIANAFGAVLEWQPETSTAIIRK